MHVFFKSLSYSEGYVSKAGQQKENEYALGIKNVTSEFGVKS